eukprot:gene2957-2116_t
MEIDENDKEVRNEDGGWLVYFIMVVQGAALLFPWNVFISAPTYFSSYYRFVEDDPVNYKPSHPSFWENIESFFATICTGSNIFLQVLVVMYLLSRLKLVYRIAVPFAVNAVILLLTPLLAETTIGESGAITYLVCVLFMTGSMLAFTQSSVFGLAAMMPMKYTSAVMLGNAVSGLLIAILRVITKAKHSEFRIFELEICIFVE